MKRILLIFATSICIVVLFTLAKYAVWTKSMPNANYGIRAIGHRYFVDDLFIGSSMFRHGINSSALGDKCFLLAYNGNQPVFEAIEIEQIISNDVPIKRLFVDMYAFSASAEVGLFDTRLFMDGDMSFTIRLFYEMRKHNADMSLLYEMLCQGNNELFVTWPFSFPLINPRYDKGAGTSTNIGASKAFLEDEELKYTNSQKINPYQLESLKWMVQICKEEGIEICFVETPKYYRMYSDNTYIGLMQSYIDFLISINVPMIISESTIEAADRKSIKGNLNSNVVTYSFDNSRPEFFTDNLHLSSEGRDCFTEVLLPILK